MGNFSRRQRSTSEVRAGRRRADEIATRIGQGAEAFGGERLLVDPDCGLRNLPLESATGKLRNMAAARDRVVSGA